MRYKEYFEKQINADTRELKKIERAEERYWKKKDARELKKLEKQLDKGLKI
jgi:hypothetical protein